MEEPMENVWLALCTVLLGGILAIPLIWFQEYKVREYNKTKFNLLVIVPVTLLVMYAPSFIVQYLMDLPRPIPFGVAVSFLSFVMIDMSLYYLGKRSYHKRVAQKH